MEIAVNGEHRIQSYSYESSGAFRDPGNYSGGLPLLNFTSDIRPTYEVDSVIQFKDVLWGSTNLVYQTEQESDFRFDMTADSELFKLNVTRMLQPFTGPSSSFITSLFSLCNISKPVDVLETLYFSFAGGEWNVYDILKQFLTSRQLMIIEENNRFVITKVNTRGTIELKNIISYSKSTAVREGSPKIKVKWRRSRNGSYMQYSPSGIDESPLVVEANQTIEHLIEIRGGLSYVHQPTLLAVVPNASADGTVGRYCVSNNLGYAVPPARWTGLGGSLKVEITDNPAIIKVTITGSNDPDLAPFRIAAAGFDSFYNSLQLTGSGVLYEDEEFDVYTGTPESTAGSEYGTTVENPFFDDFGVSFQASLYTSKNYGTPKQSISVTVGKIDVGDVFTDVIGKRFRFGDLYYLTTSISVNETSVTLIGEEDTRISDLNEIWATKRLSDVNAKWGSTRIMTFNKRILER